MRFNLPKSNAGRRVGLLGGSFDPAHEGHVRISEQALKRFDLDQVWWLVSPANPLKPQGPAPLDKRVAHAKRLIDHPRIVITDVETQLDTRFTCDSLRA
ncbi:MAG: adenylyltransferase/cytidyltransferase family protein, partial [Planktomarina temperata]|nr:adenylyltransferase/cytidyltransferase family protein [Planktomarina temperata]